MSLSDGLLPNYQKSKTSRNSFYLSDALMKEITHFAFSRELSILLRTSIFLATGCNKNGKEEEPPKDKASKDKPENDQAVTVRPFQAPLKLNRPLKRRPRF